MIKSGRFAIVGAIALVTLLASLVLARDYRTGTRVIVDSKNDSDKGKGAWLGVFTQPVDKEYARKLDLTTSDGEIITGIVDDSPADKAGFEEYDVIVSVDGTAITNEGDLSEIVGKHRPGDKVSISYIRDGKQKQILLALGDREDFEDEPIIITGRVHEKPDIYISHSRHDEDYGHIGASLNELNRQLGEYFGVERGRGALISEVEKGSPAETAGLKAGDVIVAIDEQKIADVSDAQEIIRDKSEGDKVSISILRDRKPMNVTVEIEEQSGWDSEHTWGSAFIVPPIPDIPRIPKIKVRSHKDAEAFYFDQKQLEKDLAELQVDLSGLHEELTEELAKEHQQMSKRDIRRLKNELEKLNRDVKQLH